MADTKTCPMCGETIQAVARKCRHCGEMLDPDLARARRGGSQFAPCPRCGDESATAVSFTWWGGLVGPKLLSHVQCGGCGAGYNGKTGRSNDTAIAIYVGVGVVIGLGIVLLGIAGAAFG